MKYLIIILLFLTGCKSTKMERTSTYDSISTHERIEINYDSLMYRILTTLSYEFEYNHIDWSKPDSTGGQYKESETTLRGKGKEEKTEEGSKVSGGIMVNNDSAFISDKKAEVTTPVKTLNWWDKIRIKLGNWTVIIFVAGIIYIVVWLIRRRL